MQRLGFKIWTLQVVRRIIFVLTVFFFILNFFFHYLDKGFAFSAPEEKVALNNSLVREIATMRVDELQRTSRNLNSCPSFPVKELTAVGPINYQESP